MRESTQQSVEINVSLESVIADYLGRADAAPTPGDRAQLRHEMLAAYPEAADALALLFRGEDLLGSEATPTIGGQETLRDADFPRPFAGYELLGVIARGGSGLPGSPIGS
jgi:hypothetical protein